MVIILVLRHMFVFCPVNLTLFTKSNFCLSFQENRLTRTPKGNKKTVQLKVRDQGVGVEFQIVCPASNFGTVSRNYKTLH